MPQWSRPRHPGTVRFPDERAQTSCAAADAALFQRYDHHTVWIAGRQALLLTQAWNNPDQPDPDRYRFIVSFTYAAGHLPAPPEVQQLADALTLVPTT